MTLGTGAAQAGSGPVWRVSYRSHSAVADPLFSVTAPSRKDAWAVGLTSYRHGKTRPLILHWNGSAWSAVTIPGTAAFKPDLVASSSPDNVWIIGETSVFKKEALVFDGNRWITIALPVDLGAPVAVLSLSDVWAEGQGQCSGTACTTTVWHWDGAGWTSHQIPGLVQDIAGAGRHAWILTLRVLHPVSIFDSTGRPAIYRATGGTLRQFGAPSRRVRYFAKLAASPAGQLWMRADLATSKNRTRLFHWTGRRWTEAAVPATVSGGPLLVGDPLIYDGHSGVWSGSWAHWTGRRWINAFRIAALPTDDGVGLVALATIPGSPSIWAAGWVGRTPTGSTHDSLIGVWGRVP